MSDFAAVVREEARLIILKSLAAQLDSRLNSSLLVAELDRFGLTKSRDWVHGELAFLAEIGAVSVSEAGTVRIARLTQRGLDHVENRIALPGIKRPSLEG